MPKVHEEANGKTIYKIRKKTFSEMAQICTYVCHTQMTFSADTKMQGLVDVGIDISLPLVNMLDA